MVASTISNWKCGINVFPVPHSAMTALARACPLRIADLPYNSWGWLFLLTSCSVISVYFPSSLATLCFLHHSDIGEIANTLAVGVIRIAEQPDLDHIGRLVIRPYVTVNL